MGFLKKEKRTAVSVQTQGGSPPVLPVTAGERALYRALREQVPIIDAAIYKLVRLIGGFEVYCPEKHTENALRGFLKTVPVNGCNMGIDNFLSVYFEQLLTYGNAVGEIVLANGEIRALYNASLEDLEIRLISPLETGVFVVRDGRAEPCRYPELILTSALNPMPGSAMGSSILKGLPFVSEVLLKIYRTVGINWERMGNVRFAVTCKNEGYMNAGDRAGQLAKEWSRAMHGPGVSDFVAVGDVQIKAIGADGQQMDSEVPVRQMLEQIVEIAQSVGAYVLSDEVYLPLENTENFWSMADLYDRAVVTNSISKTYSVPGARIGWTVSNRELADKFRVYRDYTMICCGEFNDALATYILQNREAVLERNREIVFRNMAIAQEWIDSEPRVTWQAPKGVSVAYIQWDIPMDDEEFCVKLLKEEGVLLVPGNRFELPGGARLGYCAPEPVLREGLARLGRALRQFD